MRAREVAQQRNPLEIVARLLLREALLPPRINRLRDLELLLDGARGTRPAVVKHLGVRGPRADLSIIGPDAKALRALIRPNVLAEPDATDLAAITAPEIGRAS